MDSIIRAIERERGWQIKKYGDKKRHITEYLTIMQAELDEAKEAWVKTDLDEPALVELLQVVTTGFAALQQFGVYERIELRGNRHAETNA